MGGLVVAIDFSSEAIRIANRKKEERRSNVTFLQGDACDLSLKDGTFDIVFSCECIEHVPQPKLTVKEMARVLQRTAAWRRFDTFDRELFQCIAVVMAAEYFVEKAL